MANPPKEKGTKYETASVRFLNANGFEARRLAEGGINDEGDLLAVANGVEFAVECKDRKRLCVKEWFEVIEFKAWKKGRIPVLMMHREGCGEKGFGGNYVMMRADDFARLAGETWEE